MSKEFKVKTNLATILFLVGYSAYVVYLILVKLYNQLPVVGIAGVLLFAFFLGCRPYKYIVDKKTITICYRLWKNSEVNIMECETICDPVSRLADLVTRPHAIEIYTDVKKRYCFFPVDRIGFVTAVVQANKRLHCTVKEYTDIHRKIEKKLRKERRKAEKAAAREQMESED